AAKTAQPTFTRPGSAIGRFFENYALVILTAAVFVFFAFLPASSRAFPTLANLNVILGSQAVVSMIALAALFPLICGYFDFSLGAAAAMPQVLSAGLMARSGLPLWLAIIIPILLAGVVGIANG